MSKIRDFFYKLIRKKDSFLEFEVNYAEFGKIEVKVYHIQFQVPEDPTSGESVRCLYDYDIIRGNKLPTEEKKYFEHTLGNIIVDYLKKTVDEK